MALPKDPRQKMINFMYLVLTAMLALNVSTEILNAFKVVDQSLIKSNGVIDKSNKNVQEGLADLLKDPGNMANAAIWKPKADSALMITDQVSKYIDGLKDSLRREAGYNPEKGDTSFKEDDLDAATRLFDNHGQGVKLQSALEKFKNDVLAVLPAKDKALLEKNLPIDISVPPSTTGASDNSWTTSYFHMTPTVAALTMLSKFQSDVKRSGNIVANHCLEQVGKVVLRLNKFEAFAGQNSQYLLPGQPFELTAGLGAFSSENTPTVTVNGSSVPVDANGVATYKETAGGGGEKRMRVVISFKNPNTGQPETVTKEISYTVGQQSGASIFLSKMNVMYIGEENPIVVSGGSGKAETMQVSFTGGSISGSGANRICVPTTPGPATVNVTIEGKTTPFAIRVKYLPNPVASVGNLETGSVSTAQFKAMGGVIAKLKDSDFESPFTVVSYTIGSNCGGGYQEANVNGAQWGGNAVVAALKPGCVVYIDKIMVVGRDKRTRKLPSLGYRLQ
jgi:gliding motility-associated protein GldM